MRTLIDRTVLNDGTVVNVFDDPSFTGPPADASRVFARRFRPDFAPWMKGMTVDLLLFDARAGGGDISCIGVRIDGPGLSTHDLRAVSLNRLRLSAAAGGGEETDLHGFPILWEEE